MYKFVVVTDPETAPGFRLAGVEVLEVSTIADAMSTIPPLLFKDDTGIVAVNEDFMASLDDKLIEKIQKTHRPIIIPIPSRTRQIDRADYIERMLRRAIGYNIVVRR
ncbi:MAG TPA: V-type ATP synthase subunit F [Candidatus Bathyarchaeia archaeon]|nr:V-type ATP synthase subunit F [Candidatus Bathyarchaeia archaeon]